MNIILIKIKTILKSSYNELKFDHVTLQHYRYCNIENFAL